MTAKRSLFLGLMIALLPAIVLGQDRQQSLYHLDWRGLPIGEFRIELSEDEGGYALAFTARSSGLLATVFPFESTGSSTGSIVDGSVRAATHRAESGFDEERRHWRLAFAPDGQVVEMEVHEDDEREPVPLELRRGPDPLSLLFEAVLQAAPGAVLERRSFDGRRAVAVTMSCDPALVEERLRCEVEGELLAGASQRWRREHGDEPPVRRPVEVLMQQDAAGLRWWPVAMKVHSRYGPVRAVLDETG